VRTYENYVIIPPSYIIPSFQVRQGHPTTRFALRAIGASPKPQLERQKKMAIYHLSTKPISRSSGRSAVASVAYRAGIEIIDERLGKTYDYTKRSGVLWTGLATPHGFNIDRNELWNRAEKTETRSNSRTAREIVINIPHELMQGDQSAGKMLAYEFATNLSQKYQIAVDVAVHAPDKQGDNRNYHAHLLLTTRQIEQTKNGFELGKKSQLEMSNAQLKQAGLLSNQDELKEIRREWAELANGYLAEHGLDERIDHRSHKDRGLETLPTVKMGWKATELERQGIRTEVGDQNRAIKAYNAQIEQKNELQQQITQNGYKDGTINNRDDLVTVLKERGYSVESKGDKIAISPPNSNQIVSLSGELFTNTLKNAHRATLEPRKNENGIGVPPTPQNTLKTQIMAFYDEYQKSNQKLLANKPDVDAYFDLVKEREKLLHKQETLRLHKALETKSKAYNHLANNKPLLDHLRPKFLGQSTWEQDKEKSYQAYWTAKTAFTEHKHADPHKLYHAQASEQIKDEFPKEHAKASLWLLELKKHEWQTSQHIETIKSQADEVAKANTTYFGEIIAVTEIGILQKTNQGLVYHSPKDVDLQENQIGRVLALEYPKVMFADRKLVEVKTQAQYEKDQSEHNKDFTKSKGRGFGD
ncbi:MobQ family relaxase, partial [Moraxella caprae]